MPAKHADDAESHTTISQLAYLQALHPAEWANFCERMAWPQHASSYAGAQATSAAAAAAGVSSDATASAADRARQSRLWASRRGQTLARTVAGVMDYTQSYKALAQAQITVRAIMDELSAGKLSPQSDRQAAATGSPLAAASPALAPAAEAAGAAAAALTAAAEGVGVAITHTNGVDRGTRTRDPLPADSASDGTTAAAAGVPGAPLTRLCYIAASASVLADWLTFLKCSHVCCMPSFGAAVASGVERQQDRADMDRLLASYPLLSVVYIDATQLQRNPEQAACAEVVHADGCRGVRHRVPLAGGTVGKRADGKHGSSISLRAAALPFVRGLYVQQLDAAQDAYAFEAFKLPNLLSEFELPVARSAISAAVSNGAGCSSSVTVNPAAASDTSASRPRCNGTTRRHPVVLVGMREHCFTQELSTK